MERSHMLTPPLFPSSWVIFFKVNYMHTLLPNHLDFIKHSHSMVESQAVFNIKTFSRVSILNSTIGFIVVLTLEPE